MKKFNLETMKGGWFVGDFEPNCLASKDCEVGYKSYLAGEIDQEHFHKIATEVTLVASGRVRMNGTEYTAGDIVIVEPGEVSQFQVIEDAHIVVVKTPSVPGDKYLATVESEGGELTQRLECKKPNNKEDRMSKSIRAIIFDLDGVLVDATEWHYVALNRALGLFGYEISRYEHVTSYNGLPTNKKLEMLTCEKGLPRGLHPLVNQIKQLYTREEILMRCRPTFQKEYMINRLLRDGFRLAVCSNSKRDSIELMLGGIGVLEHMEFIVSAEDVEKPKPDPEIYHEGLRRLGLSANEVLVVEDSPHGIEAAEKSGANVLSVRGYDDVSYQRIMGWMSRIDDVKSSLETGIHQAISSVDEMCSDYTSNSSSLNKSGDRAEKMPVKDQNIEAKI